MDEKTLVREALFAKYFLDDEDRIPITEVLAKIEPITEVWARLHKILEGGVKYFDWYSSIYQVKIVEQKDNKYLIIKTRMQRYLIIDLKTKRSLDFEEVFKIFDQEFFIDDFDEPHVENLKMYSFDKCSNASEVVDFCLKNQNILEMPTKIFCRFEIEDAFTYISFNLSDNSGQLGFRTPDQFLYEHLHFDLNLNPWGMQDCIEKIGLERLHEMFEQLKDIKIPKSVVPKYFLEEDYTRINKKS